MKYKAFISYSHVHRDLAEALEVALQRFGVAWHEITAPRIFRDAAGLGATSELWVDIQRALDDSEHFVLLASPEATVSNWVKREVDHWFGLHGTTGIIVVLASGEIVWDYAANDFDFVATTALPPAFSRVFPGMPLYVDFRQVPRTEYRLTSDAFRDKVATIASALHGKSKDELYGVQVLALVVADARRMAAESQLALNDRDLSASLRLAISAVELTEAHGEPRLPAAEAALRAVLGRTGGRPLGPISSSADPQDANSGFPPAVLSNRRHLSSNAGSQVSISPGGKWVATIGMDLQVRVWALAALGDEEMGPRVLPGSLGAEAIKFSADEQWLITLTSRSADEGAALIVGLWELPPNGQNPVQLELPTRGALRQVAISEHGRYVAASADDGSTVFVWDISGANRNGEFLPSRAFSAGGMITAFAFAVGGAALAAIGADGAMRIWRFDHPAPAGPIIVPVGQDVSSFRLAPGGQALVTITQGGSPRLWRFGAADSLQGPLEIEELSELVHWIDISPDGRWALLISGSGPSYLADLQSGDPAQSVTMIPTPGGSLLSHVFSTNGDWLATTVGPTANFPEFHQVEEPEYTVRLICLHPLSGRLPIYELHGHEDVVVGLALSPSTRRAITGSLDRTIRIWDLRELLEWLQYRYALEAFEKDPQQAKMNLGIDPETDVTEWLEEQQRLATHHDRMILERFRASRPEILIDDGYVLSCDVTDDGRWLVAATGQEETSRAARLWDLSATSAAAAPVRISAQSEIDNFSNNQAFALSADHRQVLTLANSTLWEIDAADRATLLPATRRATWFGAVQVARFSPDGDRLILSPGKSGLVLCNLLDRSPTPEMKAVSTGETGVRWADFSPDGRWFLAECGSDIAGEPSELRLWDRGTLDGGTDGKVILSSSDWLQPRQFTPDGLRFVAFDKGTGHVWDLTQLDPDGGRKTLSGHSASVAEIAFNPDGRELMSAGADGKLIIWGLHEADVVPSTVMVDDGPAVHSLAVDWERREAFVGRKSGSLQLLTFSHGAKPAAPVEIPGHAGEVWTLLSADGLWFLTTDSNGIHLFDRRRLERRLTIPSREARWFSGRMVWFTRNGRWLVVARQGQVFLVSLHDREVLTPVELRGHKYERVVFRVSNDERWLVTVDRWLDAPKGFQPISSCRIWDLCSPTPADSGVSLPGLPRGVDRLAITRDDRWLITASPDGVRLWPLGMQQLLQVARRTIVPSTPDRPERPSE